MIWRMGGGDILTPAATSITATGLTAGPMATAAILTSTAQHLTESGIMTNNVARGPKSGQTALALKGPTKTQ
jgi:hypothetical protein